MARTLGDVVDEAKVMALAEVLEPSDAGFLRQVCRMYSEKWQTPLHVVERDIPITTVLQAFFEDRYQALEDQERDELVEELLLTPEARAAAAKALDEDDEAFMREANEEVAAQAETLAGVAQDLAGKLGKFVAPKGKRSRLPKMEPDPDLPPVVSVSFVDELPDDDEWGLLKDPKQS